MLVLTRKHQEKIRIGDHIVITILKTKGKTVRVGIEAPAEVPVIRGELSFAGRPVEWQAVAADSDVLPGRPSNAAARADRLGDHWAAGADARKVNLHAGENATSRVSLQRVSRDQVSQVLPNLVAGRGPLGAMLDRRSVSA